MLDFFYNVVSWTPWTSFFSECAAIQLGLLFSLFFFNQSKTLFYSVIYMSLIFLWLGVFLSYYNLELFTGFLFVIELTVIFIIILFLFFFNFSGELRNSRVFFYKFVIIFFSFFFFDEFSAKLQLLNFNFFFDNFYESQAVCIVNDLHSLFLSYYFFNGFLLFIFGFLVFLTSIICVNLLRASKVSAVAAASAALRIYDFFYDLLSFEFLRKQNLFFQNLRRPNSRIIKRNLKEWYKKNPE